jgi:hypothetical protein
MRVALRPRVFRQVSKLGVSNIPILACEGVAISSSTLVLSSSISLSLFTGLTLL